jgi:maltooligosyltrehalose trehalohydrolase
MVHRYVGVQTKHAQDPATPPPLGAFPHSSGTTFRLFCTTAENCAVRILSPDRSAARDVPLIPEGDGYFEADVGDVGAGTLYRFLLDGREVPDPYARFLPDGVHGPAMVVEPPRPPPGLSRERPGGSRVIYELHIGTFTQEGTYRAAQAKLPYLADLGVTALELMPLTAFAGSRGWGYDGVAHFAPHAPYGTVSELCDFIDSAHQLGLSVLLDVVYNHFGPAGNYLASYSAAYFSREIRNAWGDAPDFTHPPMRRYVLDNARYWLFQIGVDGLRLDATHEILDPSATHILRELREAVVGTTGKLLIAEDDRNDPAIIHGLGMDAVWADDFHHTVRVSLTGEQDGYYAAYEPGPAQVAETLNYGWLYRGQIYPPSAKPRGKPAEGMTPPAFVYCIQNHDQIGNRALGDRLNTVIGVDAYCAASMLLLFLPTTALLFMGQEWAASTPFVFFTDHDEELGRAITRGRREEFKHFRAFAAEGAEGKIPDPQAHSSFVTSKLDWNEVEQGQHARVRDFYKRMLGLRHSHPILRDSGTKPVASVQAGVLIVERAAGGDKMTLALNLGDAPISYRSLRELTGALLLSSDGSTELGEKLAAQNAVLLGEPH